MTSINTYIKKYNISKALFLFAHPDDESFLAGITIQKLLASGVNVRVVSFTKGGKGKNHLKNISEDLVITREKEYIEAMKTLRVTNYAIYDFKDAELKESEMEIMIQIKKEVNDFNPNMILTFDPSGITGHPDHISLSKYINSLLSEYPNIKILNFVPGKLEKRFFRKLNTSIIYSLTPEVEVSSSLSMNIKKLKAIESHKSQIRSLKTKLLNLLHVFISPKEYLHEVKSDEKYTYEYTNFKI
jgi:LmbE family N-acetylglucosaminyl deacetylase